MTSPIRMVLDIEPMPAPRPRFRAMIVRGKAIAHAYHPKVYTDWQADTAKAIAAELADRVDLPLRGPLSVGVVVSVARPRTTKLGAPKPDADNYLKAVLDSLTKAGVWEDDCQVVFAAVQKQWDDEDSIGIEIRLGSPNNEGT